MSLVPTGKTYLHCSISKTTLWKRPKALSFLPDTDGRFTVFPQQPRDDSSHPPRSCFDITDVFSIWFHCGANVPTWSLTQTGILNICRTFHQFAKLTNDLHKRSASIGCHPILQSFLWPKYCGSELILAAPKLPTPTPIVTIDTTEPHPRTNECIL